MADIQVDLKALEALVRTLADGPRRLQHITLNAMKAGAARAAKRSRELVSGEVLKVRTGTLRRSISRAVEVTGTSIVGRVGILKGGKALIYAGALEYGATINAKPGGWLTIPLPAALTPAGVPRFTAREAKEFYPVGTFFALSKKKNLILFGKTGQKGTFLRGKNKGRDRGIVPLFVLKGQVVIPPKRYLRRGVEEVAGSIRADIQSQVIRALLATAGPTGGITAD